MSAKKKYDLIVNSTIIRGEKPTVGLDAKPAPNPNQMNRVIGYLPDGTKAMIAQRHGKGGMDFNKIVGGKTYAVAADAINPVYEKGADGKPTRTIKQEDGLPLYSSSGFYSLSSKEYPALELFQAYSLLLAKGSQVLLVTDAQFKATEKIEVSSELELDMAVLLAQHLLDDNNNLVAKFNADINKKRKRNIERARQEAEDEGETPSTVAPADLPVSRKDGNPAVLLTYRVAGKDQLTTIHVLREVVVSNPDYDDDRPLVRYLTAKEAIEVLAGTKDFQKLQELVNAGVCVEMALTPANLFRTSVSFKRKVENVLAAAADKQAYGDAVYIKGAQKGWCRALVAVMYSKHPGFPSSDYDENHYVAAVRQAEIGMNKKADGSGWTPPEAVEHPLALYQLND